MNAQAIIVILILAGVGFAIYWFAIRKQPSSSPGIPAPGDSWTFIYSQNMPQQMWDAGDGTYYFDFPSKDGVHYVVKKPPSGVAMGKTVTMVFNISGGGTLAIADPKDTLPATVRLHVEGTAGVNDRWWGDVKVDLTEGDHTLSVALDPAHWSGVGGGTTQPTDFATTLRNLQAVGFTCGGQSFAGHGVYASSGKVRFTLKSYVVA